MFFLEGVGVIRCHLAAFYWQTINAMWARDHVIYLYAFHSLQGRHDGWMEPSCGHHTKENGDEERERIPTASIAAPVAIVGAEKSVGENQQANGHWNDAVN
ncbi:hypothetical protein KAM338_09600 [Aeromonas caviae]|nr:hypothetical protein KAM330_28540 [Aeromonas hydrophila]GKQ60783.1 hypothetical protein KAM338_09600 [Aeromonas caviae]